MSYAVVLAPEALEDLARLPPPVQNVVEREIARLAADPVRLSRPSHFPYPLAQMYKFEHLHDGKRYFIVVLFRYGQDEQSIEIFGVAHQALG